MENINIEYDKVYKEQVLTYDLVHNYDKIKERVTKKENLFLMDFLSNCKICNNNCLNILDLYKDKDMIICVLYCEDCNDYFKLYISEDLNVFTQEYYFDDVKPNKRIMLLKSIYNIINSWILPVFTIIFAIINTLLLNILKNDMYYFVIFFIFTIFLMFIASDTFINLLIRNISKKEGFYIINSVKNNVFLSKNNIKLKEYTDMNLSKQREYYYNLRLEKIYNNLIDNKIEDIKVLENYKKSKNIPNEDKFMENLDYEINQNNIFIDKYRQNLISIRKNLLFLNL